MPRAERRPRTTATPLALFLLLLGAAPRPAAADAAAAADAGAAGACPEPRLVLTLRDAEGRPAAGAVCLGSGGSLAADDAGRLCIPRREPLLCAGAEFMPLVVEAGSDAIALDARLARRACRDLEIAAGETVMVVDPARDAGRVLAARARVCAERDLADLVAVRRTATGALTCGSLDGDTAASALAPAVVGASASAPAPTGASASAPAPVSASASAPTATATLTFRLAAPLPAGSAPELAVARLIGTATGCTAALLAGFAVPAAEPDGRGGWSLTVPAALPLRLAFGGASLAYGSRRLTAPAAGKTLDLGALEPVPGRVLRGTLRDAAGIPAAGTRIQALRVFGGTRVGQAVSGPDGAYALLVPRADAIALALRGGDAQPLPDQTSDDALDLVLPEPARLLVRVQTPDGTPAPSARVVVRPLSAPKSAAGREAAVGPFGWALVEALPPGNQLVVARQSGFADGVGVLGARRDEPFSTLAVDLATGRALTGIVVIGAAQQPVSGARVELRLPGGPRHAVSGADGGFRFEAVGEGVVELLADAEQGFAVKRLDLSRQTSATIALEPAASIVGRVELTDAARAAGERPTVRTASPARRGEVEADGRYALRGLPAGRIRLELDDPAHPQRRRGRDLMLKPGEEQVVDFPRGRTLEGRVLRDGAPLRDAEVAWVQWERDDSPGGNAPRAVETTRTDREGRYRVEALADGGHTVIVESGGRRHLREVRVVPELKNLPAIEIGGTAVAGVVRDAESGLPIPGAMVVAGLGEAGTYEPAAWSPDESGLPAIQAEGHQTSVVADRDGRFSLDLVRGPWVVAASSPDHETNGIEVEVGDGTPPPADLSLVPRRKLAVALLDPAGRPAPGLAAFQCRRGVNFAAAPQGLLEIPLIAAGDRCQILGVSGTAVGLALNVEPWRVGESRDPVGVRVAEPAVLTVSVLGVDPPPPNKRPPLSTFAADGTDLTALLLALEALGHPLKPAPPPAAAGVVLTGIPAGAYRIGWGPIAPQPIELAPGAAAVLTLKP